MKLGWGILSGVCLLTAFEVAAEAPAILLQRAGNTDEEAVRLEALAALAEAPEWEPSRREEAARLAGFVKRWNGDSLKFYGAGLRGKPRRAMGDYDFGVAKESPLRPLAELYRGRMLAWTLIENSTVRTHPEDKKWFKDEAVASFRRVVAAFPENGTARMYLGEASAWGEIPESVPGAPEWASLQREQIERLAAIIRWWIDHRQREGGEFGGGWGDDCEMWRWWAAVLFGFHDPDIVAAQRRFSRAALARPHLRGGFNVEIADVEHAAEDTTDNLIPLMFLEPAEARWTQWGAALGRFMETTWTGRNERGRRQFRSFYFSATETAPQPQRALDVIANVGALQPALLAWQRTGDEVLGGLLCEWLDTWVEAAAREEAGKPAGILPASIRWPDGRVAGAAENWWEPVKPGGYMHSYYLWPSVITEMTDAFIVAHVMTGKSSYLEPLRSMAEIRRRHLGEGADTTAMPGSEAWCGAQLAPRSNANSNTGGLVKSLARLKFLTGTPEFDDLLVAEGAEFVVPTDEAGRLELEVALRESLAALRVNFPGFTSEVRSTDRVMRFVQFLAEDYDFDGYSGVSQPKHELLYRMVTGDSNAPRFPQAAVRWMTPPREIAVRVTAAGQEKLEAELFHFGEGPRKMGAEFRGLAPGDYRVHLEPGGTSDEVKVVHGSVPSWSFSLPSRQLCHFRVEPKP